MSEQVFIMALGIAATTLILTVKMIAGAISGRGSSRSDVAELREEINQQAADLEAVQQNTALQATQLAELQERLDFAERMLAQSRDRAALKPGEQSD